MMEGLQKMIHNVTKDFKLDTSSPSSSTSESSSTGYHGVVTALPSSDHSRILLTRPPRNMVSLWTCSKLCAIFFVAGVVVGYTLKRRVRRWASRLLKRLKDD